MVGGIALLGTVTALFASWLIEQVKTGQEATQSDLTELTDEVRALRATLAEQSRHDRQVSDTSMP